MQRQAAAWRSKWRIGKGISQRKWRNGGEMMAKSKTAKEENILNDGKEKRRQSKGGVAADGGAASRRWRASLESGSGEKYLRQRKNENQIRQRIGGRRARGGIRAKENIGNSAGAQKQSAAAKHRRPAGLQKIEINMK